MLLAIAILTCLLNLITKLSHTLTMLSIRLQRCPLAPFLSFFHRQSA